MHPHERRLAGPARPEHDADLTLSTSRVSPCNAATPPSGRGRRRRDRVPRRGSSPGPPEPAGPALAAKRASGREQRRAPLREADRRPPRAPTTRRSNDVCSGSGGAEARAVAATTRVTSRARSSPATVPARMPATPTTSARTRTIPRRSEGEAPWDSRSYRSPRSSRRSERTVSARPRAARRRATTAAESSASNVPCPSGSSRASSSSAARETTSRPRNGGRASAAAASPAGAVRSQISFVRPAPGTCVLTAVASASMSPMTASPSVPGNRSTTALTLTGMRRPPTARARMPSLAAGEQREPLRHDHARVLRIGRLAGSHTCVALLRDPIFEV